MSTFMKSMLSQSQSTNSPRPCHGLTDGRPATHRDATITDRLLVLTVNTPARDQQSTQELTWRTHTSLTGTPGQYMAHPGDMEEVQRLWEVTDTLTTNNTDTLETGMAKDQDGDTFHHTIEKDQNNLLFIILAISCANLFLKNNLTKSDCLLK